MCEEGLGFGRWRLGSRSGEMGGGMVRTHARFWACGVGRNGLTCGGSRGAEVCGLFTSF